MNTKQKGLCPFCKNAVAAKIAEDNTLRRDKCLCPDCNEPVYLCRTPGCNDYAKGTEVYDHEFCTSCTEILYSAGASVGGVVGAITLGALTTAFTAFVAEKINPS